MSELTRRLRQEKLVRDFGHLAEVTPRDVARLRLVRPRQEEPARRPEQLERRALLVAVVVLAAAAAIGLTLLLQRSLAAGLERVLGV